jgi:hypothetical protein
LKILGKKERNKEDNERICFLSIIFVLFLVIYDKLMVLTITDSVSTVCPARPKAQWGEQLFTIAPLSGASSWKCRW